VYGCEFLERHKGVDIGMYMKYGKDMGTTELDKQIVEHFSKCGYCSEWIKETKSMLDAYLKSGLLSKELQRRALYVFRCPNDPGIDLFTILALVDIAREYDDMKKFEAERDPGDYTIDELICASNHLLNGCDVCNKEIMSNLSFTNLLRQYDKGMEIYYNDDVLDGKIPLDTNTFNEYKKIIATLRMWNKK
jgi:hypothetical protein